MDGNLGLVGCGQLGQALLGGWLEAGVVPASRVWVTDPHTGDAVAERFAVRAADPGEVADAARVIVLAVKPHLVAKALADVPLTEDHLVISVAAGVSRARVAAEARGARVVRVMPNVAATIGQSATLVLAGPGDDPADVAVARTLFEAVGIAEEVSDERLFHVGTALVGSAPAFLFAAIEALADGAVQGGMPRATALRLAAATMRGAGAYALESGRHPGALKDTVTSPGGTTIAGLSVLERRAFRGALIDAVGAATARSEELERS
ncbi:MAG: pyrroline-5-carboxylate reductase [Myxococcales bacterium]|nr:pyrroline-5-carboxylate reductase [Myxococcales bacterium]